MHCLLASKNHHKKIAEMLLNMPNIDIFQKNNVFYFLAKKTHKHMTHMIT